MSKLYQSNFYKSNRRQFIKYGAMALGTGIFAACTNNQQISSGSSNYIISSKLDKVTLQTNWVAQAEHGGFYQALATGIYKQHGLDVTIKPGGPRINNNLLLMFGAADFIIGYAADAINAVANKVPKITVAAPFQKDPLVLIAHPNMGNDSLQKLKGKPILVSSHGTVSYWPFLKAKYGFTDNQRRPYKFNLEPFLADKNLIQQGYATSEPFAIEKRGGFKPVVILLADYAYNPYANTIETKTQLVETHPDLVQRFVDASIKGWYSYLKKPTPGNELIKKDNPEMSDEQIAYSIEKLQEYGIINSSNSGKESIGSMSHERWKDFYESMVEAEVFKPDIDYKKAYTLQFVNKTVEDYKS